MTPRVERLRAQSIAAVPRLSAERAKLLTTFYKSGEIENVSRPVARAMAFAHLMRHCPICLDGRPNTKGGKYRVNLLPTTVHIYFGEVTGATPNGRPAGTPVSEGISPTQGADANGPTAVIKSAARIDHARTGGTLLNMKFCPRLLAGHGLDRLCSLVRAYFTMRGHHVQFNVIDAATLREAQDDPQKHPALIVRVAGYSDYFADVGRALQNEIISRTEQRAF